MLGRVLCAGLASAGFMVATAAGAASATLPVIQASPSNMPPACATPGRMMALLKEQNPNPAPRFADIAVHYMRIGEELGVRWDYAFFQMLVETNHLRYTGDVHPSQNNFAGIGATGGGVRGERFETVALGVRAHLQHLLLYAGVKMQAPVSERTRKVQAWKILDPWRNALPGPVRYSDMTRKWSPGDRGYAADIQAIANRFMKGACLRRDPAPELIAGIRGATQTGVAANSRRAAKQTGAALTIAKRTTRTVTTEPQRGIFNPTRSGLGAIEQTKRAQRSITQPGTRPGSILNPLGTGAAAKSPAATNQAQSQATNATGKSASEGVGSSVGRFASNLIAAMSPPAAGVVAPEPKACRVWTASYGGQKTLIIRSVNAEFVNYTVLDVNESREEREVDAYIAAYAKGGKAIASFKDQGRALAKAYEMCPDADK